MVCIPLNFTCLCNVSIDLISPVEVESADQQNDYLLFAGSPVLAGQLSCTDGETLFACTGKPICLSENGFLLLVVFHVEKLLFLFLFQF